MSSELPTWLRLLPSFLTGVPALAAAHPNCAWAEPENDPRCTSNAYAGEYPECALYQYRNGTPIPCEGVVGGSSCLFTGSHAGSDPPEPASWHVHIFFPNANCTDCSRNFTVERPGYTYALAMELRAVLASLLNRLTADISGAPPRDPIDAERARRDARYNQCFDRHRIVAGAPANYQPEPCIFEVDAVKEPGPFTDPATELGYPNCSFLLPGATWLPGLVQRLLERLRVLRAAGKYAAFDVLLHPNTGCEVRDHVEPRSVTWLGREYALKPSIFSCRSLGCNQACKGHPAALPPPASCSGAGGLVSLTI